MSAEAESYHIRALTPDDWKEFSTIRLEALLKYPQFFSSNYVRESKQTEVEWKDWLDQKGKCVFGLYQGKDLIGITAVFTWRDDPCQKTAILAASYIKPEHQGKGLSEKLYKARIDWAVDYAPWKKMIVSHRDGNETSRRANQKWGFILVEKRPKFWPDGITADEYHYELNLEELRLKDIKSNNLTLAQHGI